MADRFIFNKVMTRHKLLDNLLGTGQPSGWNVPDWNRPAAQEFIRAEAAVKQSLGRLSEIELSIDERERLAVSQEIGEGYEPTDARVAKARFESDEWQQAWQDLIKAIDEARKWESQWREETAKPNK